MTDPARAAGWHPDETDDALLRYWDGSGWTPHTTGRSGAATGSAHRTVRLPGAVSDHTTVPAPPVAGVPARTAVPPGALSVGGAVTAAAALVMASAALAVALLT